MADAPTEGLFEVAAHFVLDRFVGGQRPSSAAVAGDLRTYNREAMCSEEVLVCSLIYLERAVSHPDGCSLDCHTWRPMLLLATMEASKIWDDLSMRNSDFAQIAGVTLAALNDWERDFLIRGLRWDTSVSAGRYFAVYTSLRDKMLKSSATPEALTRKRLRMSTTSEARAAPPLRRSKSLETPAVGSALLAGEEGLACGLSSTAGSAPPGEAWRDVPGRRDVDSVADALMALVGTAPEAVVRV